ncbi:MAG: phosphoribosyl-AMP cyclohydrolase [Candidatus Gracilibacteria bacterium]
MISNKQDLFVETQEQGILRMSSTGDDGMYDTSLESALKILQTQKERLRAADFPDDQMWRMLLEKPSYLCLFVDETSKVSKCIDAIVRQKIDTIFTDSQTSKILLNCNQDVLLILQTSSQGVSYSWQIFSQEDLSELQPQKMYPVAINNSLTNAPLFLASVTDDTLRMSMETGNLILWSKSRNKLWIKGDTSGDYLRLRELMWDPEKKVFFAKVFPETGGVCHEKVDAEGNLDTNGTAASTCFRRVLFERETTSSKYQ